MFGRSLFVCRFDARVSVGHSVGLTKSNGEEAGLPNLFPDLLVHYNHTLIVVELFYVFICSKITSCELLGFSYENLRFWGR